MLLICINAMPEDKSCFIGFRVVLGEEIAGDYTQTKQCKEWQKNVGQEDYQWQLQDIPYFKVPEQ